MEVEIGDLELELSITGWNVSPFLISRDKAESGFARQCHIRGIGSEWRVDPAPARHKTARGIVDHNDGPKSVDAIGSSADASAGPTRFGDRQIHQIDSRRGKGVGGAQRTAGYVQWR